MEYRLGPEGLTGISFTSKYKRMKLRSLVFILSAIASAWLLITSCETGSPIGNLPPETTIFLDEINLSGDSRLNSIVRLHWIGDDQDGYVVGYEVSLDGQNWSYTTATDSLFRFSLGQNADTVDINVQIRAIDDAGAVDPEPATLVVPIKNSPPVVGFDSVTVIPDTVFTIWSTLWFVEDLDGDASIDSVFIKANDGPWYALESNVRIITCRPTDPMSTANQDIVVFAGTDADQLSLPLEGLNMNGENVMYLQARDIAGASSNIDTSNVFYLRPQQGDLLVVDVHEDDVATEAYRNILNQVYPSYDIIDLQKNTPRFWNPTFSFLLQEYDKVFWYSDGSPVGSSGDLLAMEIAADAIQNFFNVNGKIMFSLNIPSTFSTADRETSTIFGFSPIDSVDAGASLVRLSVDSALVPEGAFADKFDPLVSSSVLTGVDPFFPKGSNDVLFRGELSLRRNPYPGATTMCATSTASGGEIQQVFFSTEIYRLDKDPDALVKCFDVVLNDLFNW